MDNYKTALNTFKHQIELIQAASERICTDLCRSVDLILKRKGKILTTGVGKSGFVAERLAASLCSIGQVSVFVHPVNALHGDIGVVQEEDVMIVFSNSGSTAELTDMLLYAKSHGVKIITLTGREASPIAKLSDAVVLAAFESEGSYFRGPPMVSITAASIFSDALVNLVIQATGFNEDGFARYHPAGQLGKNLLLRAKDVMLKVEDLPVFDQTTTLRQVMLELTASPVGVALFVDSSGALEGILTDGDIRRIVGSIEVRVFDENAYSYINKNYVSVSEDISVGEVLSLMENRNKPLNVVPVISINSALSGIIRIHDILQ